MATVSRALILHLYKNLLKYSNQLVYTDKNFYLNKIKRDFRQNKHLTQQEDIRYFYEVFINIFVMFSNSNLKTCLPLILLLFLILFDLNFI